VVACSSCFFGDALARYAYYASTVLMLLLPFLMVGGSIRWLRHPRSEEPEPMGEGNPAPRPGWTVILVVAAFLVVAGVAITLEAMRPPAQARSIPGVFGKLPGFSLTNQAGQPFESRRLADRVWVANFVFTRCPTICPMLTKQMARLQKRTRHLQDVRLVSFTMDPQHDTPEVLAAYGKKHGADFERWSFLTGSFQAMADAVVHGFRVSMGDKESGTPAHAILHGTRFVLVDGASRIRGYYDVSEQQGFEALVADLQLLTAPTSNKQPPRRTE
jgi:protein SCO1/2